MPRRTMERRLQRHTLPGKKAVQGKAGACLEPSPSTNAVLSREVFEVIINEGATANTDTLTMDLQGVGKVLILGGVFLAFLGFLLFFWQRIPFLGKLPGDIFVQKGNFQFFFPIVTCIILSIVVTLVLNLVFRLFR